MNRKITRALGPLLALTLPALWWTPSLAAQTGAEVRVKREQAIQALMEEKAVREAELQARQAEVEVRLEHLRQERLQKLQEREARAALEREVRLREISGQERLRSEEALRRAQESAARAGLRSEMARERALRAAERAQQVVVMARARARLGVSLDGRQGREYDRQGARVQGVFDDSPAEEAGLREGDIITHLDGHSLLDPLDEEMEGELDEYESLPVQRLMALARELEDGQEVEVRYLRDGESRSVSLEAAETESLWSRFDSEDFPRSWVFSIDPEEGHSWTYRMPEGRIRLEELDRLRELGELDIRVPEIHLDEVDPDRLPGDRDIRIFRGGEGLFIGRGSSFSHGLSLRQLNSELGEYFSSNRGVLVLDSEEDSGLGLVPGDVILSIDGREVEGPPDVSRILRSYEEGEDVTFQVIRHGQETRVQGTMTG